jgi:hypothetical protein
MDFSTLIVGTLFGGIGFVAFVYGKKEGLLKPMALGAALMGYAYVVPGTIAQCAVGAVLTAGLFACRD